MANKGYLFIFGFLNYLYMFKYQSQYYKFAKKNWFKKKNNEMIRYLKNIYWINKLFLQFVLIN